MGMQKPFKLLNCFLDSPKGGLLASILPTRKEHNQNQTREITGAGRMHCQEWETKMLWTASMCVCVCVCVRVCARACTSSVVSNCRGKEVEKGRLTAKKLDFKKEEGERSQFLLAGRGSGTHNLCSLSVIIALGLKKRKVLVVSPSVPPGDQRVVLHWNWEKKC